MEDDRGVLRLRSGIPEIRFPYPQGPRRLPLRRHGRERGGGKTQDVGRMEQMDAPGGGYRKGASGFPGTAHGGDRVVPRVPPLGVRRMFVLHRTVQRKTAHEGTGGHPGRGGQTEGPRCEEHTCGRADLHRVLRRRGPGIRMSQTESSQGQKAFRGAPRDGIRQPVRGQRQPGRDSQISGGGGGGHRDTGGLLHLR